MDRLASAGWRDDGATSSWDNRETRPSVAAGFDSSPEASADALMATNHPSLKQELDEYNASLDHSLRTRFGMTVKTFRLIKATTQLVGAGAGIYAMSLGAPPLATFAMMAVIISGPEVMEHLINEGGA